MQHTDHGQQQHCTRNQPIIGRAASAEKFARKGAETLHADGRCVDFQLEFPGVTDSADSSKKDPLLFESPERSCSSAKVIRGLRPAPPALRRQSWRVELSSLRTCDELARACRRAGSMRERKSDESERGASRWSEEWDAALESHLSQRFTHMREGEVRSSTNL